MMPLLFVGTALAGGLGAGLRYGIDLLIRSWLKGNFFWATFAINVSGSLLLGLLTGLASHTGLPPDVATVFGVGFLGGYTTFSTASFETVRLIQERRYVASLLYALGTLLTCCLAAAAGWWLGAI